MAKKKAVKKSTKTKTPAKSAKAGGKKATAKSAKKAVAKAASDVKYRIGVGDRVPDLSLQATSARQVNLVKVKGRLVVLYFYPKDNTPGCTLEGHDFKRLHKKFQALQCEIFGVSGDSLKSHEGFKEKCGFPFELLSDDEQKLSRFFDVIQMKSLYGRKFEGIERSTFVIDRDGKIVREWRKVKVDGHADEVLEFVKSLS